MASVMEVTGLRQFQFSLAAERARLEGQVTKKYKKFIEKVFIDLVSHTPQWSGHLAANWNLLLTGETTPAVYPWKLEEFSRPVFQMGDPAAVNFAISKAKVKLANVRWNTKVTFSNPVPYATDLETDSSRLRPVNLVAGQVVLARYIATKYSRGGILLGNS